MLRKIFFFDEKSRGDKKNSSSMMDSIDKSSKDSVVSYVSR